MDLTRVRPLTASYVDHRGTPPTTITHPSVSRGVMRVVPFTTIRMDDPIILGRLADSMASIATTISITTIRVVPIVVLTRAVMAIVVPAVVEPSIYGSPVLSPRTIAIVHVHVQALDGGLSDVDISTSVYGVWGVPDVDATPGSKGRGDI